MKQVLYFTAPWCVPCKRYGPVLERIAPQYPEITFTKVDVDASPENRELAGMYDIMSIPTLVYVLDGVGRGALVGERDEMNATMFFSKIRRDTE